MNTSALTSQNAPVDIRRVGSDADYQTDIIALEVPVALVYNCISYAVMMTTPTDLEAFALGFSLSESIVQDASEIQDITCINEGKDGMTVHMQISQDRMAELQARRRNMTGRTGCGLCGTESLRHAIRPIKEVNATEITDKSIQKALVLLPNFQPLQAETGATHAAAWSDLKGNILFACEDVGRHNALDKLIGTLVKSRINIEDGFTLVTSRASYEMVQKCCSVGIGGLVAVSAPTLLAIEQAQEAGMTLVGFARNGRHVIYNKPADNYSMQHPSIAL